MSGPSVTDHLIDDFHVILGVLDVQGEPEISALLLEAAHETALGPELLVRSSHLPSEWRRFTVPWQSFTVFRKSLIFKMVTLNI